MLNFIIHVCSRQYEAEKAYTYTSDLNGVFINAYMNTWKCWLLKEDDDNDDVARLQRYFDASQSSQWMLFMFKNILSIL